MIYIMYHDFFLLFVDGKQLREGKSSFALLSLIFCPSPSGLNRLREDCFFP